jgi:hypothetical protein
LTSIRLVWAVILTIGSANKRASRFLRRRARAERETRTAAEIAVVRTPSDVVSYTMPFTSIGPASGVLPFAQPVRVQKENGSLSMPVDGSSASTVLSPKRNLVGLSSRHDRAP